MKPALAFIHDLHVAEIFLAGLVPHPGPGSSWVVPARSAKSVAKALRHVVSHLRKARKATRKAAQPSVKMASRALATELTPPLQTYLALIPGTARPLPKTVARLLARLAAKLVRQRRKQVAKAYEKALQRPLDPAAPARPQPVLRLPPLAGRAAPRKRPAARISSPRPAPGPDPVGRPPAK